MMQAERNELVKLYREHSLVILPLLPRSKQCVIEKWQQLSPDDLFARIGPDSNIGLRLDNLIALDIERPELWPVLSSLSIEDVASRTWVQRTGRCGYHVLFRGEAKPFKVDGFAEIRSGNGQYIVVAPSIHPETGRPYQWLSDIAATPIDVISPEDLNRLRHKLEVLRRFKGFVERMLECWRRYHRHNLSLWLAGCLRKMGLPLEDAEIVLKAITYLAHDEEVQDRIRALRDTYEEPASRVKAWTGLRDELIEIVGEEEAKTIIRLLPIQKGLLFEVKTLKELVEGARELEYIARPILPRGALILLTGRGGVGKSLLTLHMAHSIAAGRPIFDIFEVEPARVLILDNENSPPIYKERVDLLGLNPLEAVDIVNFTNYRLDLKGAIARLRSLITTNNYSTVFIDNWTTFISRLDENKAAEASSLLTKLRRLAYETSCAIVLIHHLRKSLPYSHSVDEVRGSSVLVNEADLVLLLERGAAPNERILRTLKNRLGEEFAYRLILRYDQEGFLHIECEGEVEEALDSTVIKCANEIKAFMQMARVAKRSEIFEAVKHYPEITRKRALNYLLSLGELEKPQRGVYRLRQTLDMVLEAA
jgi:hypothetical protein